MVGGSNSQSTEEILYSRERIYGEVPEDDEQQGSFKRHYDISVFTNLCKIVSLSSLVGIFVAPNFPLRMDIKIGGLGDMRLYIKKLRKKRIQNWRSNFPLLFLQITTEMWIFLPIEFAPE